MWKKLGISTAVVALALGVAWYAAWSGEPADKEGGTSRVATGHPTSASVVADAATEREVAAVATSVDTRPAGPPESFRRHLSGVRGRLVESDGAPVSATRLVLRQLHPGAALLAGTFGAPTREPLLELGETETGPRGDFAFHGVHPHGMIGLLVDPGGGRAAFKLIEADPPRGEVLDLGDVVLPPSGSLTGRVVDETGAPIAGARVRAGPVQSAVLMFGVQHYRRGDGFMLVLPDGVVCGDVPAWAARLVDDLMPATRTDTDGRFVLPRVSAGSLSVLVDAPGLVASEHAADAATGGERDVGDLRVSRGQALEGRVVDEQGDGVPDVEVRFGFGSSLGMAAVMRPVGRTDAAGAFRMEAAPSSGMNWLAARRAEHHPWRLVGPLPVGGDLEAVLGAGVDRAVRCVDVEGRPVTDVELEVAPDGAPIDPVTKRRPWSRLEVAPTDDGVLSLLDLVPGDYRLRVRSAARGMVETTLRVPAGPEETTLTFGEPATVDVRVIDARTSSPIDWAQATLHAEGIPAPLFDDRSDAEGRVMFGPVARGEALSLRVEHPGFGRAIVEVAPGGEPLTVALQPGGQVDGRVLERGGPPQEPLVIMLRLAEDEPAVGLERDLVWTQRVDPDGRFEIDSLPGGRFLLSVDRSKAGVDGLALLAPQVVEPRITATIDVFAGRVTPVSLDLAGDGSPEKATIDGVVRVRGGGRPRFSAQVHASGEVLRARTDESGRFSIAGIPAGPVRLSIGRPVKLGTRTLSDLFLNRELELRPGEVRSVEFEFTSIAFQVEVIDGATGAPVAGVTLSLKGTDEETEGVHDRATSDAAGLASMTTFVEGAYTITADAPAVGRGVARVDLSATPRAEPIRVELTAGVPCAGRFLLPGGASVDDDAEVEVLLSSDGFQRVTRVSSDLSFDVRGARPGTFTVLLLDAGSGLDYVGTFDLPDTGKTDLVVRLRRPE